MSDPVIHVNRVRPNDAVVDLTHFVAAGRRLDGEVTTEPCAASEDGCSGLRLSGSDLCGGCIAALMPEMRREARESMDWERAVRFARLRLRQPDFAARLEARWSR